MEEMIHCMGMEDARNVQYWNIYNDGGGECCLDQRQVGIRGRGTEEAVLEFHKMIGFREVSCLKYIFGLRYIQSLKCFI